MIRTEKNTKGRKAAETKTEGKADTRGVLSRVDVIMAVGRSGLGEQAIVKEEEGKGPTQLPRGLTPSRPIKNLFTLSLPLNIYTIFY